MRAGHGSDRNDGTKGKLGGPVVLVAHLAADMPEPPGVPLGVAGEQACVLLGGAGPFDALVDSQPRVDGDGLAEEGGRESPAAVLGALVQMGDAAGPDLLDGQPSHLTHRYHPPPRSARGPPAA